MPKITTNLGFTFRWGVPGENQYCKIGVEIADIDTSLPIEPQLKEANEALKEIWPFVVKKVNKQIEQVIEESENKS